MFSLCYNWILYNAFGAPFFFSFLFLLVYCSLIALVICEEVVAEQMQFDFAVAQNPHAFLQSCSYVMLSYL